MTNGVTRKDVLKLTPEQRAEFEEQLGLLCKKFGVTIEADNFLGNSFVKLEDQFGNWNVLDTNSGGVTIQTKDFWEV